MKLTEAFVIDEPQEKLWEFFDQVDRVAACMPGVEEVEVVDDENTRLRLTQALGPMSATLDLRMQVTERVPPRTVRFVATGRSVKGAVGNVRSINVVNLEGVSAESTRVTVDADIVLGGMMGSVGQKVVAKQARKVTQSFAKALEDELSGKAPRPAEATTAPPAAAGPAVEAPSGGSSELSIQVSRATVTHLLAVLLGVFLGAGAASLLRRRGEAAE